MCDCDRSVSCFFFLCWGKDYSVKCPLLDSCIIYLLYSRDSNANFPKILTCSKLVWRIFRKVKVTATFLFLPWQATSATEDVAVEAALTARLSWKVTGRKAKTLLRKTVRTSSTSPMRTKRRAKSTRRTPTCEVPNKLKRIKLVCVSPILLWRDGATTTTITRKPDSIVDQRCAWNYAFSQARNTIGRQADWAVSKTLHPAGRNCARAHTRSSIFMASSQLNVIVGNDLPDIHKLFKYLI